jgi:hypothetical protein
MVYLDRESKRPDTTEKGTILDYEFRETQLSKLVSTEFAVLVLFRGNIKTCCKMSRRFPRGSVLP